jgi:O-antigen ligase
LEENLGISTNKEISKMGQSAIYFLLTIPAFGILLLILKKPYVGLVILAASLPITDILPDVPFATSVFPVIGGLTIGAYLLQQLLIKNRRIQTSRRILLLCLFFIVWFLISNLNASIQPDGNGRIWLFTFVQLLALVWLTSQIMDEPNKHYILFLSYSITTGISALYAIYHGGIATTVMDSIRSGGLTSGANTAARYFLVALVFLYFLQARPATTKFRRLMMFTLMGVIILGVLVTVSRTGLVLLVAAFGMIYMLEGRRNIPQVFAFGLLGLIVMWFFADNVVSIANSIIPSIQTGSDTVGIRYALWQAGIRMFVSHPIAGVGIGRYPQELPFYGFDLLKAHYLNDGAHNMYIQVAAETGIVGLSIFMSILILGLVAFWKSSKVDNEEISTVAKAWLIAFVLIIVGGITKHDQYDKLLWLVIGASACPLFVSRFSVQRNVQS